MGNQKHINESFPPKALKANLNYVLNSLLLTNNRKNFVPSLAYGMSPTWQKRVVISDVDNVIVSWDQDWSTRLN